MKTIFDWLDAAERRPAMYLGGNTTREWLVTLQLVLRGYDAALQHHWPDSPDACFASKLAAHAGMGDGDPIDVLRSTTTGDDGAWSELWHLVHSYQKVRRPSPEVGAPLAAGARTLFDFLEDVRSAPANYLSTSETENRLYGLEGLLFGYQYALTNTGIEEPGRDFLKHFGDHLRRRLGWDVSCGVLAAITEHSTSHLEAWHRFFELLKELRDDEGRGL